MSDVVSSRLDTEPPGVLTWREISYAALDRTTHTLWPSAQNVNTVTEQTTHTLSVTFETIIHRYSDVI